MAEPQRTKGVDSARRAIQILLDLSDPGPESTVDDIASTHQISVPSAYRYISLLREIGLIEEHRRGTYVIAPRLIGIASAAEPALSMVTSARPIVDELARRFGETAFVVRGVRDRAVCITAAKPDLALSLSYDVGQVLHLHHSAASRVLLAHASPARRVKFLESVADELGDEGCEELAAELDEIATTGVATTDRCPSDGTWAVAAPIRVRGEVVAAISVAGPELRISVARRQEIIDAIFDSALEVQRREES